MNLKVRRYDVYLNISKKKKKNLLHDQLRKNTDNSERKNSTPNRQPKLQILGLDCKFSVLKPIPSTVIRGNLFCNL